jgi:acetyl-CoA carboxylase biotin carboxyl carrier protein
MGIGQKQILEMLRLIEASDYDEINLETDDFKLHVIKSGVQGVKVGDAPASADAVTIAARDASAGGKAAAADERAAAETEAVPAGMMVIRAPMLGTFYRAPAPGLPAFVEVGAAVRPEDTVCLIEVMKLFNTIRAGVAGKVVKIPVHNAATVQKDQILLIIQPD